MLPLSAMVISHCQTAVIVPMFPIGFTFSISTKCKVVLYTVCSNLSPPTDNVRQIRCKSSNWRVMQQRYLCSFPFFLYLFLIRHITSHHRPPPLFLDIEKAPLQVLLSPRLLGPSCIFGVEAVFLFYVAIIKNMITSIFDFRLNKFNFIVVKCIECCPNLFHPRIE